MKPRTWFENGFVGTALGSIKKYVTFVSTFLPPMSDRRVKCLRSERRSRERVALIKSFIYAR
jgi:hypothetical protein